MSLLSKLKKAFGGGTPQNKQKSVTAETNQEQEEPQESKPEFVEKELIKVENFAALREILGIAHDVIEDVQEEKPLEHTQESVMQQIEFPTGVEPVSFDDTEIAINHLRSLPTLASIAENLRSQTEKEDANIAEITKVIEQDPALCVKILQMANSAFYARTEKVTEIEEAIQQIGMKQVRFLGRALTLLSDFDSMSTDLNWKFLWIHNFACGLMTDYLLDLFRLPNEGNGNMAGLMHDTGKIILSYLYPDEYKAVLQNASEKSLPLNLVETCFFGMSHEEAGALFCRANDLPSFLELVMHHHVTPDEAENAGDYRLLLATVNLANYICKRYGLGFSGSPIDLEPDDWNEIPGWNMIIQTLPNNELPPFFHENIEEKVKDLKVELNTMIRGG